MEAYAQLAAEGYLVSRQGAPHASRRARRRAGGRGRRRPSRAAPRFDFRPGAPDVALFPRTAWAAALRQALRDAPDARFSYSDPRGTPELRGALATYLGRVRGVAADPDDGHGDLGPDPGARAHLPGAGRARRAADRRRGARQRRPARADRRGRAGVGRGRRRRRRARRRRRSSAATWARCSSRPPTSTRPASCSPRERRAALLAWAVARDAFVLEDDYDAEYRYDRQPVGALQGLDPQRVVYMSSISKTLAPALRIGWLVAPPALARGDRAREGHRRPRHARCSTQLALAVMLERGELDRHVRSTRLVYRAPARRAHRCARASICPSCARAARPPGCTCSSTCPTTSTRVRWCAPRRAAASGSTASPRTRPPRAPGRDPRLRPDRRAGDRARGARAGRRDRGRDTELTAGGLWLAPCSLPPAPRSGGWCLPSSSTCAGRSRGASRGAACWRRRGPRSRAGARARGTSAARGSAACSRRAAATRSA